MANYSDWRRTLLGRQRWMTFLLPFLVFMLVGALEPTPDQPGGKAIGLSIPYACYPWVYAAKIALTVAAVALRVGPAIGEFPLRLSRVAIFVGLVGGPLWIGLCLLDWEHKYLLPVLDHCGLRGSLRPATGPRSTRSNSLPSDRLWRGHSWPCGSSGWWPSCR